jgi:hypothetical protein
LAGSRHEEEGRRTLRKGPMRTPVSPKVAKNRSTGAKMLKRQMDGRANLDLLTRRFLLAA